MFVSVQRPERKRNDASRPTALIYYSQLRLAFAIGQHGDRKEAKDLAEVGCRVCDAYLHRDGGACSHLSLARRQRSVCSVRLLCALRPSVCRGRLLGGVDGGVALLGPVLLGGGVHVLLADFEEEPDEDERAAAPLERVELVGRVAQNGVDGGEDLARGGDGGEQQRIELRD
eukprot:1304374-Pleurochrysis_carterae.AAC.1